MSRRPRSLMPFLLGLLTFVVVLAGLGAVTGDWMARNLEMRSLISHVEVSEAAMTTVEDQVTALVTQYHDQFPLDATQQAAFNTQLEQIAAQGRDAIRAAGDGVGGVHWLLWHRDVSAAQEAYLAHNRAWQAYLDRASKDPAEFTAQEDEINTTFQQAEVDVRGALPVPALFRLTQRVDAIFAPAPLPAGSGQAA